MAKANIIQTPKDTELKEMLQALEEMENYANEFVNKAKGMNKRKALILGVYRAACEYSSGIRILLTAKPMAKVANVLLRSLFEVYCMLEYITLRKDDLYFLKEIQGALKGQEKSMKWLEDYFEEKKLKKVGNLEINKIRSNQAKSIKSRKIIEKEIFVIEPDPKNSEYVQNTYSQLKKIDELRPPKKPEYSIYFNYLILYPVLSADVHLGMDGISSWIDIEGKTIHYNRSGETQDDVKRVIWTAIAILKDISARAMLELEMPDDVYDKKYQDIIDKDRK